MTAAAYSLLSQGRRVASRLRERPDQTRRRLGVAVQRLDQLVAGQAGLQRGRLEVGRDQRERVVMRAPAGVQGPV